MLGLGLVSGPALGRVRLVRVRKAPLLTLVAKYVDRKVWQGALVMRLPDEPARWGYARGHYASAAGAKAAALEKLKEMLRELGAAAREAIKYIGAGSSVPLALPGGARCGIVSGVTWGDGIGYAPWLRDASGRLHELPAFPQLHDARRAAHACVTELETAAVHRVDYEIARVSRTLPAGMWRQAGGRCYTLGLHMSARRTGEGLVASPAGIQPDAPLTLTVRPVAEGWEASAYVHGSLASPHQVLPTMKAAKMEALAEGCRILNEAYEALHREAMLAAGPLLPPSKR